MGNNYEPENFDAVCLEADDNFLHPQDQGNQGQIGKGILEAIVAVDARSNSSRGLQIGTVDDYVSDPLRAKFEMPNQNRSTTGAAA